MGNVPHLPRMLGLAGLLPQMACLLVVWFGSEEWLVPARLIAAAYAALILSFLGGMWWGIAAGNPATERPGALGWLWIAAVLPSLIALACFLPWIFGWAWPKPSLIMLGAALLLSLGVDARLKGYAPPWWMQLRIPLSAVLGAATIAIALS